MEKFIKKLAYPYYFFSSIDDYQKPDDNLKKEDFFSKIKNGYPDYEKIEQKISLNCFFQKWRRTNRIIFKK